MRHEFRYCAKCLRGRLLADKIVEHGRTLQLVCPNCGALEYVPVWGRRIISAVNKAERSRGR
jgi:hypothetical protein